MAVTMLDTVIVGAGHAGVHVAESLRQVGYVGSIKLLGDEPHMPYERPPLSKGFLRGEQEAESLLLRSDDHWDSLDISLDLGERVVRVDPIARQVRTERGAVYGYANLVWTAGGSARRLPIQGGALKGVHRLRDLDDAIALQHRARTASSAVIVGGGYIGLEVAAALRSRGIQVTLIEATDRLLARVTSPVVSDYFLRLHRERGVDVRLATGVREIVGAGTATEVILVDGERLAADLIAVGVGIAPNVDVLAAAGVECSNGVVVDSSGRTNMSGIYAAGDCAFAENAFAEAKAARLESVPNATAQARAVASAIVGAPPVRVAAPWFWSHQYDTKLQTAGLMAPGDEAVVRGDPESSAFAVVYLRGGRVAALDSINSVRDFTRGRRLVEASSTVTATEIAEAEDLASLLA
ncbi:NAD(P)/FAD-dependent oxidoreductase [Microbacterium sp. NPDC055357]